MAGFFIDSFMDTLLDEYWGNQSPDTPPATWYIALFTTMPANDGTGAVEAAWSGYARQASTNDLTEWPAASAGVKSNANVIDYGEAGSGPTSVVGFGFYDDPTAGNLWFAVNATGSPIVVGNGADASFESGAIVIQPCS
jgi:hypothetical protein